MKSIIINNIEYNVYGNNEVADYPQPHIAIAFNGEIPSGKQLGMLKTYLIAHGISPIDTATTHWCINRVLNMDNPTKATTINDSSKTAQIYLEITEANIEEQDRMVQASDNYGKESRIIHDVLNTYPKNDDLNTIATKIALIDVTNSTHLSQYKSQISIHDLANVILNIKDFDGRLSNGDLELVNIIAKNTGVINLFSFGSKYCTYHNVEIYGRDDYSIFDGVVQKTLPHYKQGLSSYKIDNWRTSYDYVSFNNCIGELLDEHNIHISFRRRKFDHFLWYGNR